MPGSASTIGSTSANVFAVAEPSMSIGFAVLASIGMTSRSAAPRLLVRRRQLEPGALARVGARGCRARRRSSAARRGGRAARGCSVSSAATSTSSSSVCVRMHAGLAEERVDGRLGAGERGGVRARGLAPARVVPPFIARIGFVRATRRAMRANARGLPNDSR